MTVNVTIDVDRRAIVVADVGDTDAGYVGVRLRERGYTLHEVLRPLSENDVGRCLAGADLVLLLGSAEAVHDPSRVVDVAAESAFVRAAVDSGLPVLAICYGAQLAAHALGGSVRPVERGEVGWFTIDSIDDRLCGAGPWLQFHSDVLTEPVGARVTGRSPCGPQGFVIDPVDGRGGVVAWQFHPEVMAPTLERWVAGMHDYVRHHGGDPERLVTDTRARGDAPGRAAAALVDAALEHLGVAPPAVSRTAAGVDERPAR